MTKSTEGGPAAEGSENRSLALLLAMAMFVFVIDTSLMNVSISAVVRDLHTTVSGVQSAIAIEALVGASAAIAAAIGPLLGGFLTTYLSWRVGFMLEAVVIVVVVLGSKQLLLDVPYTGERGVDRVGSALSVLGMGGLVLGILAWQEGGESVGVLLAVGLVALGVLVYWLSRRKREGKPALLDPTCSGRSCSASASPRGSSSRLPWAGC